MSFQSCEDLEVWKRGCALAVYVYKSLVDSRDLGLRDQMQRSVVLIPSNIAEGYERTDKDFARFLSIAPGSAAERRTQTFIADKVEAISAERMNHIADETKPLPHTLQALAKTRLNRHS